jgi:hypothetical protein
MALIGRFDPAAVIVLFEITLLLTPIVVPLCIKNTTAFEAAEGTLLWYN